MHRCLLTAILAILLVGCSEPGRQASNANEAVQEAVNTAAAAVADPVDDSASSISLTASAVAMALANTADDITTEALPPAPVLPPPPPAREGSAELDPAVGLIIRWEVTSEAHYTRRLQGIVCPGGHSGPTGGIGYDFGQQTQAEIRRVWNWHPDVERLATASGQNGEAKCAAWRARHRDIRITFEDARRVFQNNSLPKYRRMALRALPGLDRQTIGHIGGLSSTGYRRGWAMDGPRMLEKRIIRGRCIPADDAECTAGQVEAMCRLWAGTANGKGQCNRSHDEARVIRS